MPGIKDKMQETGLCIKCAKQGTTSKKAVINKFFSDCPHKVLCLGCALSLMQEQIKNKIIPMCIVQDCGKPMVANPNNKRCLFSFFSTSEQKIYFDFVSESSRGKANLKLRQCQKEGCGGVVENFYCCKCHTYYCQRCKKIDHEGRCQSKSQIQINQARMKSKCGQLCPIF